MKERNSATPLQIGIWYTISGFLVRGISFISTPFFTRILTQTEYGEFNNFISWESILTVIVTLNLYQAITPGKYDFSEQMDSYLSSILFASNVFTIISYLAIEVFKDYFTVLLDMPIVYIRILFLYLFFMPAFTYLQMKHRIYYKYKFFVAFSICSVTLRTGCAILFVKMVQDKLFARTLGYVLPITVMNVFLWALILWKGRAVKMSYIKHGMMICVPMIPGTLGGALLGNSDRIMITRLCGAASTSLYSVAYQVAFIVNILWGSMNQAWTPWQYDQMAVGNIKTVRRYSTYYLLALLLSSMGVMLIAPEIVLILGGSAYYEARFVMPPVVGGCIFQFLYGLYVNIEIYLKKTIYTSVATFLAAMINILLNLCLIPVFGYIAAAYTTLLGYFVQFLFHYLITKRMGKFKGMYNERLVWGISGLTFILCVCVGILYHFITLRYMIIIFYMVAFLYMGFKIKKRINTGK
jgi:O-antigen/teichoic acid export membrane protein